MYRTGNKPLQGEPRPVRPVWAYFPIMTAVLYIIPYIYIDEKYIHISLINQTHTLYVYRLCVCIHNMIMLGVL